MKTVFTFLIVNFIFLTAFAQHSKGSLKNNCDHFFYNENTEPFEIEKCNSNFINPIKHNRNAWQNSLELKQSLDSVVSEYYDNDTWNKYYLSEYVYNTKGFNTQSIHHDLDEDESSLIPLYKDVFFFDENGNVTTINHSRRDEFTGEWEYSSKREYNYDIDNNLVSYVLYSWNESNTDWIPFHKVAYDYDLYGNVIEGRSYGWNEINEEWDLFIIEDFIYDENTYLVQRTSYSFMVLDEWRNSRKTEYVNDQNGNTLQRTSYKSLTGDDWVYDSRGDREFNFIGLITKAVYTDWVDSIGQWINDIRQDYAYDTHENLIESTTFAWDTISNNWLSESKVELAYNLNFILEDLLLPTSWPEFGISYNIMPLYKNMLTEVAYFAKADTTWKIEDRENYYYAERNISAISEMQFDDINIYPNPANDLIKIEGFVNSEAAVADLFDIQGRHLFSQDVSESNQINVSHLKSGLYICKIKQNGQTSIQKILIK